MHTLTPTDGEDFDPFVGTSLRGQIDVGYDELVAAFGKPTPGDGHKTDACWYLLAEDGKGITIYNYKDGPNYCGPEGTPVEQIRDWHIGAHRETVGAVDSVKVALGWEI